MKGLEVVTLFRKNGWILDRVTGAHHMWMRLHRSARGWSQIEAARRLGVSRQTYRRFEDPDAANPGAAFRDKGRLGAGSGGMFRSSGWTGCPGAGLGEVRGGLGGHLEDCTR